MFLQLDVLALRKPVDEGLSDLLHAIAGRTESISEPIVVGDMHVSDWSLFDSPEPLLRKQHDELQGITSSMLKGPVRIYESWFHIARSGSAFGRHRHAVPEAGANQGFKFSLVYYVDRGDPNGTGQFRLLEPDLTLSPESGMILVFPAYVEHEVLEYRGERDRIIIGANFQLG